MNISIVEVWNSSQKKQYSEVINKYLLIYERNLVQR